MTNVPAGICYNSKSTVSMQHILLELLWCEARMWRMSIEMYILLQGRKNAETFHQFSYTRDLSFYDVSVQLDNATFSLQ